MAEVVLGGAYKELRPCPEASGLELAVVLGLEQEEACNGVPVTHLNGEILGSK